LLPRNDEKRYTKDGWETYVCYESAEPVAYVVFSTSKKLAVNHYTDTLLTVKELAYISPAALGKIFSFLRMFEGEFDEIEICDLSLCPEVDMMMKHYMHTSYTIVPDISARVLNTETLLASNTYPQKEGGFTVRVMDDLPTAKGVYKVSYGGGECRVMRLCESASADAALTASAFVQLAYGYHSLNAECARYIDGFEMYSDCEELFRAFPKKPCGVFEHF
jgi:predicted acetyltransferase